MKLFDSFEAVKFLEENLIFITREKYLYYIYYPRYKSWRKYKNAGNDALTVKNYGSITKEELLEATGGVFPQKVTDILRLCEVNTLWFLDMMNLLENDYPDYMKNTIHRVVNDFLSESVICYKSYLKVRELFDQALLLQKNNDQVLAELLNLIFVVLGRDIFKEEIKIVDGHDPSSYFWFKPARVIDYADTQYNYWDNVAVMKNIEISVEEDDVSQFLEPFLMKHFDSNLEANQKRIDYYRTDENGDKVAVYYTDFEWYLTHNYYTFDSIRDMINDISDTIDALSNDRENEFTGILREKRGTATFKLCYAKGFSQEQIDEYNANRPTEDTTDKAIIIDFYRRFIYRMEYMIKVGAENGFDLVSVMGP